MQLPSHETSDYEDEFDTIERDLRAKQHITNETARNITVDAQTKIRLAQQASHASLPGVVPSNTVRSKPDVGQMEYVGKLRRIQKNRRAERNREEHLPVPISVNEEQGLYAFQGNMHNFQRESTKMEDEELRKQKEREE